MNPFQIAAQHPFGMWRSPQPVRRTADPSQSQAIQNSRNFPLCAGLAARSHYITAPPTHLILQFSSSVTIHVQPPRWHALSSTVPTASISPDLAQELCIAAFVALGVPMTPLGPTAPDKGLDHL